MQCYYVLFKGGLPTAFSCFIMPPALYLSVFYEKRSGTWYLAAVLLVLGCFLLLSSTVVDTYRFAGACASKRGCGSY